jgi:hypothetical protein
MAEATGTKGQYSVTTADISSPDSISEAYNSAAAQGEIASSVWDGRNVNIITRGGGGAPTGKKYRTVVARSGSTEELQQSLNEATREGGRIVSTVWDGKNVNVVIEE